MSISEASSHGVCLATWGTDVVVRVDATYRALPGIRTVGVYANTATSGGVWPSDWNYATAAVDSDGLVTLVSDRDVAPGGEYRVMMTPKTASKLSVPTATPPSTSSKGRSCATRQLYDILPHDMTQDQPMNFRAASCIALLAAVVSAVALALSPDERRETLDGRLEAIGNVQAVTGRVAKTWRERRAQLASNETATALWKRSYESNDVLAASAGLDYTLIRTRFYALVRGNGEVIASGRWSPSNTVSATYESVLGDIAMRGTQVRQECARLKAALQERQASGASGDASGTKTAE